MRGHGRSDAGVHERMFGEDGDSWLAHLRAIIVVAVTFPALGVYTEANNS